MDWKSAIKGFRDYLRLEKNLLPNSIEAYLRDIDKLVQYQEAKQLKLTPNEVGPAHLEELITWANELGMTGRSQARMISGIRAFYKYLLIEDEIDTDPTELLSGPKLGRQLPDVLDLEEIEKIMAAIDHSTNEGIRNRAILETLYGCGLRVGELVNLKISNLFLDVEFVKVTGKGNKERLVPIGQSAIGHINYYFEGVRNHQEIKDGETDFVFLNRRGAHLTRVMIFTIIKGLVKTAGIKKNVSPHTFRHSFASHLVEGGADLRAVQDMLGHESITTTEIYTHPNSEYLRDTLIQFHPRFR